MDVYVEQCDYSSGIYKTSGTFPAPPGSFLKKNYINMTINIIHVLSN